MSGPTELERAEYDRRFDHHPPNDDRAERHAEARGLIKNCVLELAHIVPEGREWALVLTNMEQAMFWANAAIAREP